MKLLPFYLLSIVFLPLPVFGQVATQDSQKSYAGTGNLPTVLLAMHGAVASNQVLHKEVPKLAALPNINNQIASSNDIPMSLPVLADNGDSDTVPIHDNTPAIPSNSIPQSLQPASNGDSSIPKSIVNGITHELERDFSMPGYKPPESAPIPRRAPDPPLDPVFPSGEFLGTDGQSPMGVNDNNYAQYPLEQFLWNHVPVLKKNRIRIYGWFNPSYNYGTSANSNFPMSYIVAARKLEIDQAVIRLERIPDTVQKDHPDWGFRFTSLYGEDYRFTTAKGWFSGQLLGHNNLTGWDPCECYTELYVPKIFHQPIFDGLLIRAGRYISCPDIEAQLAPDNYLFTHSLMFTFDTYTQTGIQGWLQLNKYWNVMAGICAGADSALWGNNGAIPTAQLLVRYVSKTNKDSIYAGINDINGGKYRSPFPGNEGKDNLQQINFNYTHVFNHRFHTVSELYYLWTWDALKGGTVSNGPPRYYGGGGGPGAYLPGQSHAVGFVNYTLFKMTDKDYLCFRPVDILADPSGWRSGFATTYYSATIGWCHRFSELLCIRPELRMERSLDPSVTPYNNGTKRSQLTFACDLIQRF